MHFWLTTLVIAITILLWASARLPEYLTALLFFAAATLLNIAPTSTIFSGFASSAFWLVLSGFVLGAAIRKVGLAQPVVLALGERAGIKAGSRGNIGLALAVGFGTFQLSASILPANVPNLVLSGAAENAYQIHLQWLPWWLLHMPVVGIGKGMILAAAILFL
ncbi:anion permease, partial [Serratia sp. Se-PFBMAAmG]|nr:anion permease [Serratia sp. Se-PFBMAAmG]